MIGSFFALLTSLCFGVNAIFIRRAVIKVSDASLGTFVSVPMGLPLFFLILAFTGQIRGMLNLSWQSYAWFSSAGILHFVVGRSLYYKCTQLVGANISGILRQVNILVTVVIGISLLHEPFSWQLVIGVLLIITGITFAGSSSWNL